MSPAGDRTRTLASITPLRPVTGPLPPVVAALRLQSRSFGGTPVLGPLELDLRAGETVALVGPSGIGKSTLLRILAGLDTGFQGERNVQGRIAMVFQEPVLLPWRTVAQNLTLTAGIAPGAVAGALAEVGLGGLEARFPGQLSLGQQRRLALARAFAAKPDLLLMDEAFVSLDRDTLEEMYRLYERLRRGRGPGSVPATLMVTHDLDEARRLASRILRLDGRPARLMPG